MPEGETDGVEQRTMRLTVPDGWTERTGDDRIGMDGFAGIRTQLIHGEMDTDTEGGQISSGVGVSDYGVTLDLAWDSKHWSEVEDDHIGVLGYLSSEQARELAYHLAVAATAVEERGTDAE